MEIKKSPKADLEPKRGLFLEIGLTLSLLLIIGAFAYNQKDMVIEIMDMGIPLVEEEIIEITRQEEPKKPIAAKQTVSIIAEIINVVTNDAVIEDEISFDDFDEDILIAPTLEISEESGVEDDTPFLTAEVMPKFQGKELIAFQGWVGKQIRYPVIAAENGIQGVVILTFVVARDGTLTQITVLQSPDSSLSDEAIRVLKTSPKWSPGMQRNKPVLVKYTLPVHFRLE